VTGTIVLDSCSAPTKTRRYTLHAATTFTPAETALIYFHNFAKLPSPQHKKKSCMKNPNKEKYCLAAELRPGRDNFMVYTEFGMTLMGHRTVSHFEPKHTQ